MARRAARVDWNHQAIAEVFRAHGCQVESLAALGRGVPDLLVGWQGRIVLVEVKTARGQVRKQQEAFAQRFPVEIVRSDADANVVIARLKTSCDYSSCLR